MAELRKSFIDPDQTGKDNRSALLTIPQCRTGQRRRVQAYRSEIRICFLASKFHAALGALQRDRHASRVRQLDPSKASNKGAAGANSVVAAGKILQFTQPRNPSRQPHRRCANA